jgi:hypothetical protein
MWLGLVCEVKQTLEYGAHLIFQPKIPYTHSGVVTTEILLTRV